MKKSLFFFLLLFFATNVTIMAVPQNPVDICDICHKPKSLCPDHSKSSKEFTCKFSCEPKSATLYIDGHKMGPANGAYTLKKGKHLVKLVAKGYHDLTTWITATNKNTNLHYYMKYKKDKPIKKASKCSVTFSCDVNNAKMFVDGNEYSSPNITIYLTEGVHTAELQAEGYEDLFWVYEVNGDNIEIHSEMVRLNQIDFEVNGVSFTMVFVEGGAFKMGNIVGENAHWVTLSSYYIGKYEVTQALWMAVMGSNPSYFCPKNGFDENLQRPVEQVSWYDCQEFITKLNELTGKQFCLPTEAEWEYAALGGNNSRGYSYAGSSNLYEVVSKLWTKDMWSDSKDHGPCVVGSKIANELDLYDMSGNVWEWCQDWYDDYTFADQVNPKGPKTGKAKILRGGSWDTVVTTAFEICNRSTCAPDKRSKYSSTGLRLALDI